MSTNPTPNTPSREAMADLIAIIERSTPQLWPADRRFLASEIDRHFAPLRAELARLRNGATLASHLARVTEELAELIKDEQDDKSVGITGWTALHESVAAARAALNVPAPTDDAKGTPETDAYCNTPVLNEGVDLSPNECRLIGWERFARSLERRLTSAREERNQARQELHDFRTTYELWPDHRDIVKNLRAELVTAREEVARLQHALHEAYAKNTTHEETIATLQRDKARLSEVLKAYRNESHNLRLRAMADAALSTPKSEGTP